MDYCEPSNYIELDNNRHETDKVNIGQPMICDDLLTERWYRFVGKSGNQMADHVVDQFHCGTMVPVYMTDSHPTKYNEEKNVKVCMSYNKNPCYPDPWNIKVMRCKKTILGNEEDFYVYKLKPVPGCNVAYCGAGTSLRILLYLFGSNPTTPVLVF